MKISPSSIPSADKCKKIIDIDVNYNRVVIIFEYYELRGVSSKLKYSLIDNIVTVREWDSFYKDFRLYEPRQQSVTIDLYDVDELEKYIVCPQTLYDALGV